MRPWGNIVSSNDVFQAASEQGIKFDGIGIRIERREDSG